MTAGLVVDATAVTKRFGSFVANDSIDLQVGAGEVVGLLGANGAGKSTFMRVLLGLLRPTEGRVELFGRHPSRAVRRRIGYVPQGLGLYEDLTVEENLQFVAGAYGTAQVSVDGDAGLSGERSTLLRELPLGLRRRLAFAAALGHDPALLVLDEPTSGMDPLARSRLWDTIRAAADAGATVLVSTHYMEEVEHCDRIVVLVAGRVAATGTPAGIVGGRQGLQVCAPAWDAAFQALDEAGLAPSLYGRQLRLVDADPGRVTSVLQAAGVEFRLDSVPARFDEVFVALVARAGSGP